MEDEVRLTAIYNGLTYAVSVRNGRLWVDRFGPGKNYVSFTLPADPSVMGLFYPDRPEDWYGVAAQLARGE